MAAGSPDSEVRACSGVADWTAMTPIRAATQEQPRHAIWPGEAKTATPRQWDFLTRMATARACAPQPAL